MLGPAIAYKIEPGSFYIPTNYYGPDFTVPPPSIVEHDVSIDPLVELTTTKFKGENRVERVHQITWMVGVSLNIAQKVTGFRVCRMKQHNGIVFPIILHTVFHA